jgi:hypothetical protein
VHACTSHAHMKKHTRRHGTSAAMASLMMQRQPRAHVCVRSRPAAHRVLVVRPSAVGLPTTGRRVAAAPISKWQQEQQRWIAAAAAAEPIADGPAPEDEDFDLLSNKVAAAAVSSAMQGLRGMQQA